MCQCHAGRRWTCKWFILYPVIKPGPTNCDPLHALTTSFAQSLWRRPACCWWACPGLHTGMRYWESAAPQTLPAVPTRNQIQLVIPHPVSNLYLSLPFFFPFLFSPYLSLFASFCLSRCLRRIRAQAEHKTPTHVAVPPAAHAQAEATVWLTWKRHFKVTKLERTLFKWMSLSDLKCFCVLLCFIFNFKKDDLGTFRYRKKSRCQENRIPLAFPLPLTILIQLKSEC